MTLTPGARLGPYEVLGSLGAGGMGEVYRATDTNLKRLVAIKVLPVAVAGDADRLARFQREAEVLAALNHPNIAAIYGLERTSDATALVMELVEGDDLSQRLARLSTLAQGVPSAVEGRGAIPVDEALPIAKQIAEALEAAHEQGIIHRDLKPANIKVRADGTVKVLDFGLAKALDPAGASSADAMHSPTLTARATQAGVILGTAAYMSPEQARGRAVDKRADIWAFGVVLYEMLTGTRLFEGDTISDTLAAVLTRDPDWARLPDATPPSVRRLLRRCLERDPRRRLHDMADARLDLEDTTADPARPAVTIALPPTQRRWPIAVATLVVAAAAFAAGRWVWPEPPPATLAGDVAFSIRPDDAALIREMTLSRDGRRLVYVLTNQRGLLVRDLDHPESRVIPGTDGAEGAFLSPDGEWLGFFAGGKLRKLAFAGGDSIPICDAGLGSPYGALWGRDGAIYFTPSFTTGLMKVDANGGTPVQITTPDRARGEAGHMWAHALPDGKALIFTIFGGSGMNGSKVAILDLASGRHEVLFDGAGARYVHSGHLVFYRRGAHYAVPFDPVSRKVTGEARAVLPHVRRPDPSGEVLQFAFAENGRLALVPSDGTRVAPPSRLAWVLRDGTIEPLSFEERNGASRLASFHLSPNGQLAAVTRHVDGESQIWIYDLVRLTEEQLTRGGSDQFPVWHPDGAHVGYTSIVNGNYDIWWAALDGSRPPAPLITGERDEAAGVWSRDGRSMLFTMYSDVTGGDLVLQTLGAPESRRSVVATPENDGDAWLSSDGQWLAYRTGDALYVSAFPGLSGRTLIARGAGSPRWSERTRELFFISGSRMMASRYTVKGGAFEAEAPTLLFDTARLAQPILPAGWAVSLDGQRFLVLVPLPGQTLRDEIQVRLNGFDELGDAAAAR